MYGKMQESGLTEILPLICTSTIWGQYPVFSHPEFPQGSPRGVAAVWWLPDGRYSSLPEFPQGSPAHLAAITDDCDILCLLIWQAIFHLSVLMYHEWNMRCWEFTEKCRGQKKIIYYKKVVKRVLKSWLSFSFIIKSPRTQIFGVSAT